MEVHVLKAPAGRGKTPTFQRLLRLFEHAGFKTEYFKEIANGDFLAVLTNGTIRIGLSSEGDYFDKIGEYLSKMEAMRCDRVATTARSWGITLTYVKKYTHHSIRKTEVHTKNPADEVRANQADANNLFLSLTSGVFNTCSFFQQLAQDTWNLVEDSRLARMSVKEESITDLLMLRLKLVLPHKVLIKTFTRIEEGRNGADWEWWFYHGNQYIGFRVQAKIINIFREEFSHLHYKKYKSSSYQSDTLIAEAAKGVPKIPLYCLYIHTYDTLLLGHAPCRFPGLNHQSLFGCSLIGAHTVQSLRLGSRDRLDQIDTLLKPWHCLVCCKAYGGNTPIERMDRYARNVLLGEIDASDTDRSLPASFITDTPPDYVKQMIVTQGYEGSPYDEDLAGVMVMELGNDELEAIYKENRSLGDL